MSTLASGRPGHAASFFAFLRFLIGALLAGGIGALVTLPAIPGWYGFLAKPAWTPPDAAFGPAWTTLYVLMSVAAWLVWRRRSDGTTAALRLFWLQLVLNGLWSPLFFGLRRPGVALIDILLLDAAVLATLLAFRRIYLPAGLLFLPYLAWVCYATALNAAIWKMNG